MSKDAGPDAFELQLAMVNAYGEDGKVQECYDQVKKMLAMHPNIAALVTWGYNALLKAYRWVLAGSETLITLLWSMIGKAIVLASRWLRECWLCTLNCSTCHIWLQGSEGLENCCLQPSSPLAHAPYPCVQYLGRTVRMPDKADRRCTAPCSVLRCAQIGPSEPQRVLRSM